MNYNKHGKVKNDKRIIEGIGRIASPPIILTLLVNLGTYDLDRNVLFWVGTCLLILYKTSPDSPIIRT